MYVVLILIGAKLKMWIKMQSRISIRSIYLGRFPSPSIIIIWLWVHGIKKSKVQLSNKNITCSNFTSINWKLAGIRERGIKNQIIKNHPQLLSNR
mgnify:CR=1 FL=1